MALYIPHSIFHLARLFYVRPETYYVGCVGFVPWNEWYDCGPLYFFFFAVAGIHVANRGKRKFNMVHPIVLMYRHH